MSICLRRREFITGIGGAAAWPLAARAQQRPIPTIGFLAPVSNRPALSAALSKRLMELGYVEGQNVKVEYRLAGEEIRERHREFAADLVRRQVAVILASATGPAFVAKSAATSTIPIVFYNTADPVVKLGLVASVNRPEANVTGIGFDDVIAKKVELLCQLVPTVRVDNRDGVHSDVDVVAHLNAPYRSCL